MSIMVLNGKQVSNDGESSIEMPYIANVSIKGDAAILFHRWSCDGVEAKSKSAKNSKAKKTDDVESYVYRLPNGNIAIPGEYLRMSIIMAAKFRQDPRSPRKSAMDLFKAGVISLTELADTGKKEWDYLDRRRVTIQRNGITRTRPALNVGWEVDFEFQIQLPEYISDSFFRLVLNDAGRLIGLGDFRPTYGRFSVTSFKLK